MRIYVKREESESIQTWRMNDWHVVRCADIDGCQIRSCTSSHVGDTILLGGMVGMQ